MTASVSNRVPNTEPNPGPAPVRVSPAPVRESPPPVHTSPAPVRVSPALAHESPAPVRVTLPPSRSATQSREPSAEQPSRPAEEPADDDLPETIRKIWPQVATPTEAYRPSWNEPAKKSQANGKTPTMHTSSSQTSNLNESPSRKSSDAAKVNGCEDDESKKTTKACVCKARNDMLCHCKGDPSAPSCGTCGGVRTALSNGGRSEDSAVDSMTEPTSSSTDGSVGGAAEPARPAPEQSYAAIHLPAQVDRRAAQPPQPPQPPPLRRHDFTITRSPQSAVGRSRLSRSSSAGRPASSAGCPPRPRASVSADRPATSGAHQRPAGGSPDRAAAARPCSAPVRGTVSAPTLPRRQPAAQRTGRQTAVPPAGTSPPPRRRRARSQDPTLTFQEWLQQHERERAKAIQDRKNNARKRKQEANIKQEKAPQAFRVWLRKKRQQQLMEQRVQQLRQHEMLAAAAAAPPGRHQQDAFRQWLARKQRERLAAGLGPSQATLRSLSALYRVGRPRPPSGARPPTAPAAAAGDRATLHTHLQHIYGPNVGRGHRCRPACLPGT
ncbi:serine/arginine repetitive matrix protein 1-like [Amphibalanus amphitrite]|uniref:serine/arginine repetitive matrix protein 1-like n=1 Tax=Amphibalanus amphitrite TaxID=1232801 RepID=UPI001C902132|nr:serine/arginine repetitive matrix protein 1-like [Amphibalanus amphitrite]